MGGRRGERRRKREKRKEKHGNINTCPRTSICVTPRPPLWLHNPSPSLWNVKCWVYTVFTHTRSQQVEGFRDRWMPNRRRLWIPFFLICFQGFSISAHNKKRWISPQTQVEYDRVLMELFPMLSSLTFRGGLSAAVDNVLCFEVRLTDTYLCPCAAAWLKQFMSSYRDDVRAFPSWVFDKGSAPRARSKLTIS